MTNPIQKRLDEMLAVIEKATRGPWKPRVRNYENISQGFSSSYSCGPSHYWEHDEKIDRKERAATDANFIAQSRTDWEKCVRALQVALMFMAKLRNDMGDHSLLGILTGDARREIEEVLCGKEKCPPHKWDKDGERCVKCGDKD